jgi:hypothetical protein
VIQPILRQAVDFFVTLRQPMIAPLEKHDTEWVLALVELVIVKALVISNVKLKPANERA